MIDTKAKSAGLLVPIFALRRDADLGIGDTQAAIEAIDFCERNKITILQVLPINETGGDNSPYNAISSVALDPVLLTLAPNMVPGLTDEIVKRLVPDSLGKELRSGAVDYLKVKPLKLAILHEAFENFKHNDQFKNSSAQKQFEQFKKDESSWLSNYALFRSLVDENDGNSSWTTWREEHRNPVSAAAWVKTSPESAKLTELQEFYAYVQWVAFGQWHMVRRHADSRKVELMGDIPFGVSRYSADVWANQDLFDLDWSGGAPPEPLFREDEFTAKWGQNWGLPLYHWEKHKKDQFRWWRQRVEKCTSIFHYFRIDHVLGFFRIYSFPWIPERNWEFLPLTEEEAVNLTGGRLPHFKPNSDDTEEGAEANKKAGEELLKMVLAAAGKAGVVAEDLGVVPNYARPTLTELGIPGFTIPYWERSENRELKPKAELPALSLATWATHDHQPLAVYYENMVQQWHGPDGHEPWLDIQRLMRWLDLDENQPPTEFTPQLHEAFMKSLLETPCWLAIFMVTDLFGTKERFNQPGTSGGSNWSRRLDSPLSYYEQNSPYRERIRHFSKLVQETGRLPKAVGVGTIR